MICPNCESIIDDNCDACYNCGMEFSHEQEVSSPTEEKVKKKKEKKVDKPKKPASDKFKVFKRAGIAAGALAVIVIVFLIIRSLLSVDGAKIAASLGSNVGKSLKKAQNDAKITLVEVSASEAINRQSDFDCIFEAKDSIKVDGVSVPEWVIKVTKKNEDVLSVYYRNYKSQEDYYKGQKLKEPIEKSEIQIGMSEAKVTRLFDIEPISVTYYIDATEVCYMYYFINDNKDEERRMLVISYDDVMEVRSVEEIDMIQNPNLK